MRRSACYHNKILHVVRYGKKYNSALSEKIFWKKIFAVIVLFFFYAVFFVAHAAGDLEKTEVAYAKFSKQVDKVSFEIGLAGSKRKVSTAASSNMIFRDAAFSPQMVVVPAGKYLRGAKNSFDDNERPVKEVRIPKPFAVGRYEITRKEFQHFVDETKYKVGNRCRTYENSLWQNIEGRNFLKPAFKQGDNHPVVCINWYDAQAYIKWLNAKVTGSESAPYRLLSEAEWEYVARAGSITAFSFGDDFSELCQHGNGADESSRFNWRNNKCFDGVARGTNKVGSYKPNKFGLYDVHGNVREWVQDHYHSSYKNSPTDGRAWEDKDVNIFRVVRGGSWFASTRYMRSASRERDTPTARYSYYGFRVARTIVE